MTNDYRFKLLKTFWLCASRAGVNEDDARAFALSVYPRKRLSNMTIDELEKVTREFIKTTGADVKMPLKKIKNKRQFFKDNRLELATARQIALIDDYADALGLENYHLEALMYRAGARCGQPMTLKVAQNLINALKNMLNRGWRPKIKEDVNYENVTWN